MNLSLAVFLPAGSARIGVGLLLTTILLNLGLIVAREVAGFSQSVPSGYGRRQLIKAANRGNRVQIWLARECNRQAAP